MKTLVSMYLTVQMHFICISETFKNALKSTGTWNVRTLSRAGKLANVIIEMKRGQVNILGLSEVRRKECDDFVSDGVRVVYSGE